VSPTVYPIKAHGDAGDLPRHVAIIMDGNGRWATSRRRPRTAGHLEGARAVRRVVEHARRRGLGALTLYAFSSDNWQRPAEEVSALMALFRRYLAAEVPRCVEHGIRFNVIGRRDRLTPQLRRAIAAAEETTRHGHALHLRVAVDYSSRDLLVEAARRLAASPGADREAFARELAAVANDPAPPGDVDLLIRTGGEQRLSDFLLWECAYAELVFTRRLWPEFTESDLDAALSEFAARERRFGRVEAAVG
jgi:undecaprenyl diphosphate synthase